MNSVLLTGATGFLGSHIAEILSKTDCKIIALKRPSSNIWRCDEFNNDIEWIDLDDSKDWKQKVIERSPSLIIHSAWIGVEAKDRNDWIVQSKNIELLIDLLNIVESTEITKVIFLGSQAEYGKLNAKVSENVVVEPLNAYASIKLACLQILETFSTLNNINWVWLRIFSVFGEREDSNWLIPSVIGMMKKTKEMNFTDGEQRYAYLYARDFARIVKSLVEKKITSGIYNVSSNQTMSLKSVLINIRDRINPSFTLNFGALSYRDNQSMHIEGDIAKIEKEIGSVYFTDFNVALSTTLNYYLSK